MAALLLEQDWFVDLWTLFLEDTWKGNCWTKNGAPKTMASKVVLWRKGRGGPLVPSQDPTVCSDRGWAIGNGAPEVEAGPGPRAFRGGSRGASRPPGAGEFDGRGDGERRQSERLSGGPPFLRGTKKGS